MQQAYMQMEDQTVQLQSAQNQRAQDERCRKLFANTHSEVMQIAHSLGKVSTHAFNYLGSYRSAKSAF